MAINLKWNWGSSIQPPRRWWYGFAALGWDGTFSSVGPDQAQAIYIVDGRRRDARVARLVVPSAAQDTVFGSR